MEFVEGREIIRRYPELILISNCPVTWDGMLSIPVSSIEKKKIRLRLTLPKFPLFEDASIEFGKNSAILSCKDFVQKTTSLLQDAVSVTSFLKQLQLLIGEILHHEVSSLMKIGDCSVISELEAVMRSSCDVQVSESFGLDLVKLTIKDISIELKKDTISSDTWKIISCDLAQLPGSELEVGTLMRIRDAANKLEEQVELLENVWEHLADIDRNCWVIDPRVPKPHHVYRRIKLTSSLSILITINPSEPNSLPDVKPLGRDSEVSKYRLIITDNFEKWDPSNTISENLLVLLNLEEFPRKCEIQTKEPIGLFGDAECCICFELELCEVEFPDRKCDNEKCQRIFHTSCLSQWLRAIPGNQVVFDQLYGSCPHCNDNIVCPVE